MSLVPINWMVKKTIEIHCGRVKRRGTGKRRVIEGDDEQCSQAAKFRKLRNFAGLRKFLQPGKFLRKIWLLPCTGTPTTTQDKKL